MLGVSTVSLCGATAPLIAPQGASPLKMCHFYSSFCCFSSKTLVQNVSDFSPSQEERSDGCRARNVSVQYCVRARGGAVSHV